MFCTGTLLKWKITLCSLVVASLLLPPTKMPIKEDADFAKKDVPDADNKWQQLWRGLRAAGAVASNYQFTKTNDHPKVGVPARVHLFFGNICHWRNCEGNHLDCFQPQFSASEKAQLGVLSLVVRETTMIMAIRKNPT
jgi:hypothetical protein